MEETKKKKVNKTAKETELKKTKTKESVKSEHKDVKTSNDNSKFKIIGLSLGGILVLVIAIIIFRLTVNTTDDGYKTTIVKYCDTYQKEFRDSIKSKYLMFLREIESFNKDENFKKFECEISKPIEINKKALAYLNKQYKINSNKMYKYKITLNFKDNHKEIDVREVIVAKIDKNWKVYKESK